MQRDSFSLLTPPKGEGGETRGGIGKVRMDSLPPPPPMLQVYIYIWFNSAHTYYKMSFFWVNIAEYCFYHDLVVKPLEKLNNMKGSYLPKPTFWEGLGMEGNELSDSSDWGWGGGGGKNF